MNLYREFVSKKCPRPVDTTSEFVYPIDGLLTQDVAEEDELRRPTMLDANGERCLLVIKNGNCTGVTIGRATGPGIFRERHSRDVHDVGNLPLW